MKLTKAQLKEQSKYLEILKQDKLSVDEIDLIYENFNPGMIDNLSQGVYFTPWRMTMDVATFAPKRGHILDLAAGIGGLAYRIKCYDSYERNIQSITCIEMNPKFVEIGKKLLPSATWICANAFEPGLIDNILKEKGIERFTTIVSNPPFGKIKQDVDPWTNYKGNLDLMFLELCLRYGQNGYYILPAMSSPFTFSGRNTLYTERLGREITKFIKANGHINFNLTCDGIDCDIYKDEWFNLSGIAVEAVNVDIYPYSLDCVEDSITIKVK